MRGSRWIGALLIGFVTIPVSLGQGGPSGAPPYDVKAEVVDP